MATKVPLGTVARSTPKRRGHRRRLPEGRHQRDVLLTETSDLVHFGSNDTDVPVVILVAALIADGAPLATPVSE